MRDTLAIVGTVCAAVYGLWIGYNSLKLSGSSRRIRRAQKSAGGMFSQLNSVTGRNSPPRIGLSVWFLLLVCVLIIYAMWK